MRMNAAYEQSLVRNRLGLRKKRGVGEAAQRKKQDLKQLKSAMSTEHSPVTMGFRLVSGITGIFNQIILMFARERRYPMCENYGHIVYEFSNFGNELKCVECGTHINSLAEIRYSSQRPEAVCIGSK